VAARLQFLLFAVVALIAGIDLVWANAVHFDIDVEAYALLGLLWLALSAGGIFYRKVRRDEQLAAMLSGTGFLLGMSAAFSVLNVFLLTVAGARIDTQLAAADRALGVDWPAMMAVVSNFPIADFVLQLAYISVLPQIALMVVALGFKDKPQRIYELCFSVSAGAAICIAIWTIAPSFGAFSVYELPPSVAHKMVLALDGHYAQDLVRLLAHGPERISPSDAKGLIGFPSYHAVMALLVAWHARELPYLRWGMAALNAVVIVATPIQGGHHVVDVLAGFVVAAAAAWLASRASLWALRERTLPAFAPQPANP
jgi:hypothetical protein